jgi:hypothetical protein
MKFLLQTGHPEHLAVLDYRPRPQLHIKKYLAHGRADLAYRDGAVTGHSVRWAIRWGRFFFASGFWLEKPLEAAHTPLVPRPRRIRGGKACTERHFDFDQGNCDSRGPLRGGRACVGSIRNQWEARPGCEQQNLGPHYCARPHATEDALTGPDDQPGLDSRDAYTLRIIKRGAEIRTRSSATLYNVVQTKVQLVDEGARRNLFRKWSLCVADPRLQGLKMDPDSSCRDGGAGPPKPSTGTIFRIGCGKSCTASRMAMRCRRSKNSTSKRSTER